MATDSESSGELSAAANWGLAISREAWLDRIDRDTELQVHHEDEHFVVASWKGMEGVFCHRHGLVTARHADPDTLDKLGAIAQCACNGGAEAGEHRRVIPRATAAAMVVAAGVVAAALGKEWLHYLQPSSVLQETAPAWLTFLARALFTTGMAAVAIGWILALASLFPWETRKSLCAAAVLCAGLALAMLI